MEGGLNDKNLDRNNLSCVLSCSVDGDILREGNMWPSYQSQTLNIGAPRGVTGACKPVQLAAINYQTWLNCPGTHGCLQVERSVERNSCGVSRLPSEFLEKEEEDEKG